MPGRVRTCPHVYVLARPCRSRIAPSRCALWLLTRCLRHRPDALTSQLMRMPSQCNTDVSATGPARIRRLTMGLQRSERARDLAYSLFSSASTTAGLAARGPLQHQQRHFPCTGGDPEERRRRRRRAVLIVLVAVHRNASSWPMPVTPTPSPSAASAASALAQHSASSSAALVMLR